MSIPILGLTGTPVVVHATDPDDYWSSDFAAPVQDYFLGIGVPNGSVECIAEYNGNLIIGGSFLKIGNVSMPHIAAWNGSGKEIALRVG